MYIWVSMHDILDNPTLREVVLSNDEGTFYKALDEAGFDINDDIEWQACYHRRLNKEVVYGVRIFGREKTTEEWLSSGNASLEARKVAAGRKDVSLLREMEAMSKQPNFTGQLVEHLENYWGADGCSDPLIEVSL